jgi:hypothetical protein
MLCNEKFIDVTDILLYQRPGGRPQGVAPTESKSNDKSSNLSLSVISTRFQHALDFYVDASLIKKATLDIAG